MSNLNAAPPSQTVGGAGLVAAANAMTARWTAQFGDQDFALSAAGVWPLIGLLASAADDQAGAELAAALGRPVESAQREALELLDVLRSGGSTAAALGLWARSDLPLHEQWTSQLPAGVVGQLTDQEALDRWAAAETNGLIDRFPLALTPDTELVLASALAARVRWRMPFDSWPRDRQGSGDAAGGQWLQRTTSDLTAAAVLDGTVTRVVVEGDRDIDVHLLLGDHEPADVLATGLRELSGEAHVRLAADIDGGDTTGLTVSVEESSDQQDRFRLRLPSFDIGSNHDLLEYRDVFGLRSVTDPDSPHLPLLSPSPLFVARGAQDVVASFSAEGFEAAAVSAFGVIATGAPLPRRYRITAVDVSFDRPFGFLAVHRPSRLAVVAGWVRSPFDSAGEEE
ncbi:hypothetical protein GTV32_16375 [Gordonia sp. SID5947]|uniref:serpin family protein n=1 Tax=Gordonia sp. SID5947 TaxID=2690315 RepID=UPI00136E2C7C|nr:serpin family protein [Gordonia sp. SID5947]MYR07779.1 hypothetical protein [Gordonia sp. SID5947]